jgi:hypothetical protein
MESLQPAAQAATIEEARGRSTVEFPYFDLESGTEIAKFVRELGGLSCDPASLAAKLNMSPDGGGFRLRLLAAKTFGIVAYGRAAAGQVELTALGQLIADPDSEKQGRFDAFMSIPLYRTLFDRLKGSVMPPPPAIERMMEGMGVAPKQKEKARQVFLRSAKQAGLFELSSERMTRPNLGAQAAATPVTNPDHGSEQRPKRAGGGSGGDDTLHPFIRGLIDKLPPADSEWDLTSRAKWLTTAANIFDLMYVGAGDSGIHVTLQGSTLSISTGELT